MQTISTKTLEDTLFYQNIPVFIYHIHYPSFVTSCNFNAGESINTYYATLAKSTEYHCRTVLFAQAVKDKRYIPAGRPFHGYTLDTDYHVTYNEGCISSLYTETYTYMGGAHGETKRTSDTWDFNTGKKLRLTDFYPLTLTTLHTLQKSISMQISERLKADPGSYFENYKSLLEVMFNVNNFYIKPETGVIYYQQYDIAPYSAGLPEFYVPVRLPS